VPTDFAARSQRRPFILIAVWLVVLQAFVAGLAAARSGAATASDPVVCHGAGEGADPATPDPAKLRHLCCAYCMSAAPALPPPAAPHLERLRAHEGSRLAPATFTVIVAPGAVRAGQSQAPPPLA
jgi:hypothetical protein